MKKYLITMLFCITLCISAAAQAVTGEVIDIRKQPLAYANIVLQTTDSTFVTGTVTDEKGDFKLKKNIGRRLSSGYL